MSSAGAVFPCTCPRNVDTNCPALFPQELPPGRTQDIIQRWIEDSNRRGGESEGSAPAPSRSRCRHGRYEGTGVEGSPIRSRVVHACGGDVRQGQDNEPCHVLELTCAYRWTTLAWRRATYVGRRAPMTKSKRRSSRERSLLDPRS